jgi:hypothetical protein
MAKTWDDFLPLAVPHLPGCPNASIKTYLALAARDFFTKTYLWQDDIDAIYLAPNQVEYDLDAEAEVEDVLAVVLDNEQLDRTEFRLIPFERRDERGQPRMYWIHSDRTIRVFPTPDRRATMKVSAVLKPARNATGVEDWVYETWADVIISGAISQLAIMPGKEWSSMEMATLHKGLYEQAITKTRIRDYRGVQLKVRQRAFV